MLRTALAVNTTNGSGPPRTIVITSAIPEEGKSTLTRSLAMAYFEAGLRVLLIDADLRKPTLASSLGVDPPTGLSDVLIGQTTLDEAVRLAPLESGEVSEFLQRDQRLLAEARRTHDAPLPVDSWAAEHQAAHGPQVAVLSSGTQTSDPAALFGTRRMAALLEEAKARYDMVLIDTAPLLAVSDAIPLLPQVDGVLLVTRVNHTTRDDAKRARHLISRVPHIRILGVVGNGATSDDSPYPYAYAGSAP
jgi:Mrp family chromosome partitioning ATPase